MKPVGRVEAKDTGMPAVYLSDGTMNMALVKSSRIPKRGVQLLGIKVESIKEIGERLEKVYLETLGRDARGTSGL